MIQLKQFLRWQLRDLGRMVRDISLGGFFAFLIGGQLGSLCFDLVKYGQTNSVFLVTLPCTVLLMVACFLIKTQWRRFKQDQERIIIGLKANPPPRKP